MTNNQPALNRQERVRGLVELFAQSFASPAQDAPPPPVATPAPDPVPPPPPQPAPAAPPAPPGVLMPQPAPGRVLANTDPESHARWAEFDRQLAAGELRIEDTLPPEAEGVLGTTPERTMVERYCRLHPNTVHVNGQFFRLETGRGVSVSLDRFHYEIHAIVDHARAGGNIPRGSVHRLHGIIAERVRLKLTTNHVAVSAPNTLACANGLLDLPVGPLTTAQFRPFTPADFVTAALPYAFDPAAQAPVWDAFLQSRVPGCAAFLQEFAGLALTTETRYEIALWLHGRPGTGKSTFLHGLQALLGSRAGVLNPLHLMSGRVQPAALEGKSLLVCTEPLDLSFTHTARFHAFVSGEPVSVEPKYRQPQVIQPRAKLAWAFTVLPRLADADSPLFRRVAIVPFPALPPDQQDVSLKSRLEAEGPGLLNWALAGLIRLTARGRFDLPPAVLAASDEFRLDNDLPAQFLDERCDLDPQHKVQSSRLHRAFSEWCRANGHPALSSTLLARDWARLGLQRQRLHGRSHWTGLRLKGV